MSEGRARYMEDDQSHAVVVEVAKFVETMRKLGVTATWSTLYNASTPTYIIALEQVSTDAAKKMVDGGRSDDG